MLLGFENPKFYETLYRLLPLQVSNLLVVWIDFIEVIVRQEILPLFLVMTSFVIVKLLNLYIFVEHNIGYQPCKFQLSKMFGFNFTEGGGKHPPPHPQCCTGRKSPVLLGLTYIYTYHIKLLHVQ